MTYSEFEALTETQQLEITSAYLVDHEIVTEAEFSLVTSINGYNLESVNDMLYARTGYHSYGQLLECQNMTDKQFKIWLINNDLNQKQLAKKLQVTDRTITNYKKSSRFPKIFLYALKGIENEK